MSAFEEKDKDYFFGREDFVDSLFQVTHKQPLVVVIGPSGSGKSSVVFAGLIPLLRAEGTWLIESFRPQNQPFYELASALVRQLEPELGKTDRVIKAKKLAKSIQQDGFTEVVSEILKDKPEKHLLLVVDQFEELYTLCQNTQEQQQFVDILLAAVRHAPRRLILVLTLRADFYSYVLNYPPFGEALEQYPPQPLRAMKWEEMKQAIEAPAKEKHIELESRLTERILDDVKQEAGNLPLLEFALTQLWAKQVRGKLTHQAYTEIGGVAKALANHAESIYDNLSEAEQRQMQQLFVQLVRPGEGTEDTRRLATRAEVKNWELVTFLAGAEARLVVTGRNEQNKTETVEVVHEALIREWKRLGEWMESDRTFRNWQEGLRFAMHQWQKSNNDEEVLLRGAPLAEAENWLQQREDEISQPEWEFIQSSLALRDRLAEQEKERSHRELRQQKAKTRFAITTAVLAITALATGGIAWQQNREAQLNQVLALAAGGFPKPELLPSARYLLEKAKNLHYSAKNDNEVEEALTNYRAVIHLINLLENNQNKISVNQKMLAKLSEKTEKKLVKLLIDKRFILLKEQIENNIIGNKVTNISTKYADNYTEGALKTTYRILYDKYGVKADIDGDGQLKTDEEAKRMPCDILIEIEKLWKKNTECTWSKPCEAIPDEQSLFKKIFNFPKAPAVHRLNYCGISSE
ncbi:MAG: ATP-binding protein [Calothrix sp. MO_192.B10]|nr:ATP-binding protein [Calothrix sp. MO_192.B10]